MSSATSELPVVARAPGVRAWRSLGARFALLYVVVTLAAFVAACLVLAVRTGRWADDRGRQTATEALDRVRRAYDEHGEGGVRDLLAQRDGRPSTAVLILDRVAIDRVQVATDGAAEAAGRALGDGTAERLPPHWYLATTRVAAGRELRVTVLDHDAATAWARAREDIAIIAGVGLLAAVLGAFALSRSALRPVADLAQASARIVSSGDLSLRVPDAGRGGELAELTVLFNQVIARNERLVRAMKESLDNVAHDLRTPLTRLRAGAELALSRPEAPGRDEALADVIEEVDRVLAMLASLMDIAEAETGVIRLDAHPTPLAAIAREAVDLYELVAKDRGVHVVTRLSTDAVALVDRRRMLQVVANLLDNAIKYTPPGGRVEVETRDDPRWGILVVTDTGIGIAPADQPRVWDRLFRADPSRSERGLGLGLALVKAIVEAHGGTVSLESELGRGTRITVRVPRPKTR